jgi:hypothetical protein
MQTVHDESSSEQDLQKTEKSLNKLFEKKLEEYDDDDEELINDELEHNLEDSIENYEIPEESKISKILSD